MNDNSQHVLEEMERRNIPKTKLACYLGMFDFSFDKRLERGLTDDETKQILSVMERRFKDE